MLIASQIIIPNASCSLRKRVTRRASTGRWKGMEHDTSDDQLDIVNGRGMVEPLFQGGHHLSGTHNQIIHDVSNVRQFSTLEDNHSVSPLFFDTVACHLVKNYTNLKHNVPLILGIWGEKGQGKTYQTERSLNEMGCGIVNVASGELESENAGEPAKIIRQRYVEAGEHVKKGKMAALLINDIDAGVGILRASTQYTVNNQMTVATLMNIADNPTDVRLPGSYGHSETPRVPIFMTGNDFSNLYRPLTRDGRMMKFRWQPSIDDIRHMCAGIYKGYLSESDIDALVSKFPDEPIDFFNAIKATVYDKAVHEFIRNIDVKLLNDILVGNMKKFTIDEPTLCLDDLVRSGYALQRENEAMKNDGHKYL